MRRYIRLVILLIAIVVMNGCDKEGRYLKKPKKVTEESVGDVESMIDTKSHIETNTRSDAEFRRFGKNDEREETQHSLPELNGRITKGRHKAESQRYCEA